MSKRSYPSDASKRQKAIVKKIKEKQKNHKYLT